MRLCFPEYIINHKFTAYRCAVSAFIIYFLAGSLWGLSWPALRLALPFVDNGFKALGLGYSYNLFSPNVRTANLNLDAIVIYPEGKTVWQFPRCERMGLFEAYQRYRYRKFLLTYFVHDSRLWKDVARYVQRISTTAGHVPRAVVLVEWQQKIPPPEIGLAATSPAPWKSREVYTYICPVDE